MRCLQCEFENMPGLTKCMRCGSVLQAPAAVEVHPPRMSRWKKPVRHIMRSLRQTVPAAAWSDEEHRFHIFPEWLRKASRVSFFGAVLSFIPGFAHIIQRRFFSIRWWVLAWLVLLLGGLFLFGSTLGQILLGAAVGVHVWIALHSAVLKEYDSLRVRVGYYLAFLVIFYISYQVLGRVIFFNMRPGFSASHVPAVQVHRGDLLLGRTDIDPNGLARGSYVLTPLSTLGGHNRRSTPVYVQVVALPGEVVDVNDGSWTVNGNFLDTEQYPIPVWLTKLKFRTVVPEDSYFINAEFRGTGYNSQQAASVCIVVRNRIEAKAFMRWIPLRRRGFIAE
ncbi:MAG: S26 family signal peptidase [Planctomycetaceae bacterium]|nr:S26 family signal peptidase [Planctomycetaceae bacterium]